MNRVAAVLQVLSTVLLGLMAGFFFAFTVDVVPAMRELDAHAYIATQQAINRAVRNVPFALAYFGSAFMPMLAAAALAAANRKRDAAVWLGIALTYLLGVFALTREINVPINDALALWDSQAPPVHWEQARDDWNFANLVRCVVSGACFVVAIAWPRNNAPAA